MCIWYIYMIIYDYVCVCMSSWYKDIWNPDDFCLGGFDHYKGHLPVKIAFFLKVPGCTISLSLLGRKRDLRIKLFQGWVRNCLRAYIYTIITNTHLHICIHMQKVRTHQNQLKSWKTSESVPQEPDKWVNNPWKKYQVSLSISSYYIYITINL